MKRNRSILFIFFCILLLALSACTKKEDPAPAKPAFDLAGKTYYNTVDNYGHEDHSKLWLGKDGSFVFSDSYKDGVKDISGKWTLNEDVLTLEADDGKKIILEVKDDDTLTLKSSLDGSKSDDSFSTTEVKGSTVTPKDDSKKDDSSSTTPSTPEPETKEIPCTGITSLYHNYWSYEGTKNWDLEIRPVPENTTDKMTFKSNDESVVKIDDQGRASAVGVGKTTIDVTCGSKKLTVGYEVRDKEATLSPEGAGKAQTYKAKIADVISDYQPSVFFDSGFFTFTENVYAGMGKYKGTYEKKDDRIYCTVTDASTMEGFKGDNVKEIVFKIVDEKTLKLKTELCMSGNGDLFYLVP